jgi:cytochrome c-type biogenesis protein CcmI
MLNLTLIICMLISLAAAYLVVAKPLFLDQRNRYFQSNPEQADFDTTLSLLETIAELETDYKMGKLTPADYESLSLEYKRLYLAQQDKQTKTGK